MRITRLAVIGIDDNTKMGSKCKTTQGWISPRMDNITIGTLITEGSGIRVGSGQSSQF